MSITICDLNLGEDLPLYPNQQELVTRIKEYFADILTKYEEVCCSEYGSCDDCQSILKLRMKNDFNEMDRDDQPRCRDRPSEFLRVHNFHKTDIFGHDSFVYGHKLENPSIKVAVKNYSKHKKKYLDTLNSYYRCAAGLRELVSGETVMGKELQVVGDPYALLRYNAGTSKGYWCIMPWIGGKEVGFLGDEGQEYCKGIRGLLKERLGLGDKRHRFVDNITDVNVKLWGDKLVITDTGYNISTEDEMSELIFSALQQKKKL